MACEQPAKMALIGKATGYGNFGQGNVGVAKHVLHPLDTMPLKPGKWRQAGRCLERAREMTWG